MWYTLANNDRCKMKMWVLGGWGHFPSDCLCWSLTITDIVFCQRCHLVSTSLPEKDVNHHPIDQISLENTICLPQPSSAKSKFICHHNQEIIELFIKLLVPWKFLIIQHQPTYNIALSFPVQMCFPYF